MRRIALVVAAAGLTTFALALNQPPAPAPAPASPVPATALPIGQPAAATDVAPKKYQIPADAKPVARVELEGGLIVEDFVLGTGSTVVPDGAVVANYHGTLKSTGAAFDSTWDPAFNHTEPAVFGLNQVIAGWTKGLPGMKEGGLRRLTIPAAMAYGEQEKRNEKGEITIPSNSDLVFVVEMVGTVGVEDTKVGEGDEVSKSAVCLIAHSVKTADGAVVESSTTAKPYICLPGESAGLSLGLRGMKVGGKRTVTIPAQLNQNAPLPDIKRPSAVAVVFEVELLAVRNLPTGPGGR